VKERVRKKMGEEGEGKGEIRERNIIMKGLKEGKERLKE